ncbi:hypothetical protein GTA08_BOTSDO06854 [Botryosphaeria dothidea]|uniref:Protein kinase domain-containing protein n=1 Tax=Botryosphaeria dothidea TaxID=55169 RepID=A0A8H4IR80_9PEZI|nr:hypothetical protein GTA08_BOTSDO06854 [Botryosphaeria dothidea]
MADSQFKVRTMSGRTSKGLALNAPQPRPALSGADAQLPGSRREDDKAAGQLEIGVEFRLDLRAEDLIVIRELGHGNGGTVSKVQHAATKAIMARKIIHVEAKNESSQADSAGVALLCHGLRMPVHSVFLRGFQNESGDVVMAKSRFATCGVSSELEGSVAETFVGTGTYMAPERIQGAKYTVKSDVWSVGLTLMELAIGKFPFNNSDNDDETGL